MATNLSTGAPKGALPKISAGTRVAIVTAEESPISLKALTKGAADLLTEEHIGYDVFHVPGAIETYLWCFCFMECRTLRSYNRVWLCDRGGTPHFDYVCDSVTKGITEINLRKNGAPVILVC